MRKRSIPMTAEILPALEQQLEAFRQKFGRDPGPDDPVFFDPVASEPKALSPRQMEEEVVRAMRRAGFGDETINAARQARFDRPVKKPRQPRNRRR